MFRSVEFKENGPYALVRRVFIIAIGLLFLCITNPAVAQNRKPPPPSPVPADLPKAPDIELWAQAYDAFGAPEILVLCGWSSGLPTSAAGESTYFNLAESPFAVQLQGAFVDVINDPRADVYLVDNGAVRDAIARLQNNLYNNSEAAAVRLLANELQADVVIQIQLIDRQGNDAPNRVRFQTIDVSNGRTLTTKVFDWKLGNSTADVKRYAEQIARLFIEDFAARSLNSQKYNLRIFGPMADARLGRMIKNEIEAVRGVKRVRARSTGTEMNPVTGEIESLARFEVSFTGDFMDLSADVAVAMMNIDDVDVRVFEAAGRQLSLNVTPIVEEIPEETEEEPQELAPVNTFRGCLDLILDPGPRGEQYRTQEIYDLYRKQDSPSVAVLINREPTMEERVHSSNSGQEVAQANTIVMVNSAGRDIQENAQSSSGEDASEQNGVRRISQLERQTNLVEAALFKRLGPELLRFERKDASTARTSLLKHMDKQTQVYGQDELVQVLRQLNIADIVIFGSGADLPEADGRRSVTYTFRAIQISDAGVVGVASAREILDGRSEFDIAEAIADQAIKDLICEMRQSWEPPNELDVTLTNISNADDLDTFIQAVKNITDNDEGGKSLRIVGRTDFEGAQGQGTATITISYNCSFNDLIPEIRELASQLPYDLDVQSLDASQAKLAIVR